MNENALLAIQANHTEYMKQVQRLANPKLTEFLEDYQQELIQCPASTRYEYVSAHPGGLMEHSLRTLKYAAHLRNLYRQKDVISSESLVAASFLGEIGKLGLLEGKKLVSYYQPQTSSWHIEKLGQTSIVNPSLMGFAVVDLSLMLCSRLGISLSTSEWQAISTLRAADGKEIPNPAINMGSWLPLIISQAISASCLEGKDSKESTQVFSNSVDKK